MVCSNGKGASYCNFPLVHPQQQHHQPEPPQQQQRPDIDDLIAAKYPRVRFQQYCYVVLKDRAAVSRCITNRVRRITDSLTKNSACHSESRRVLGHAAVYTCLRAAYKGCRRDIFLPSISHAFSGCILPDGTIAREFLCAAATFADPLVYASALSAFLAYGVDFAPPIHVNGAAECSSLASLDTALHCLHAVVRVIYSRVLEGIDKVIAEERLEETEVVGKGENQQTALDEVFLALINSYTIVSLLGFFAAEESGGVSSDVCGNVKSQEREEVRTAAVIPTTVKHACPRYTTAAHLYRLFDEKVFLLPQKSSSASSPCSVGKRKKTLSSISDAFSLCIKYMIDYLTNKKIHWDLKNEMNLREAHDLLFCIQPLKKDIIILMAYYCRQFPVLYHTIQKNTMCAYDLESLIHSRLLYFPPPSEEEVQRESSIFYQRRNNNNNNNNNKEGEDVSTRKDENVYSDFTYTNKKPISRKLIGWKDNYHSYGDNGEELGNEEEEKKRNLSSLSKPEALGLYAPKVSNKPADMLLPSCRFVGLLNVGNTCFINSFTQLFFVAHHFRMDLLREKLPTLTSDVIRATTSTTMSGNEAKRERDSEQSRRKRNEVTTGFAHLMMQMHWMVTHGFNGRFVDMNYYTDFFPEVFRDECQHDASEYGKVMLELLDNDSAMESRAGTHASRSYEEGDEEEEEDENCEKRREGQKRKKWMSVEEEEERGKEELMTVPFITPSNTQPEDAKTKSSKSKNKGGTHESSAGTHGSKFPTVVARWFGGVSASLLECMECHHKRTQLSPFWDISIPLRREEENRSRTDMPEVRPAADDNNNNDDNEEEKENKATEITRGSDGRIAITRYNVSENDDDDETIILPLTQQQQQEQQQRQQQISLQELVDELLDYRGAGEILHGDSMTFCETCHMLQPVSLRTAVQTTYRRSLRERENMEVWGEEEELDEKNIEDAPFYLTLQLNRFQYIRDTGRYEKVMDKVTINKDISLPVRVVIKEEEREGGGGNEDIANDENVLHTSVHYRLIGVLIHSGPSPRSGHYFTLLRSFSDARIHEEEEESNTQRSATNNNNNNNGDLWVLANDSKITMLSEETIENILNGSGGVFGDTETPYIVLYERCGYLPPASDNIEIPTILENIFQSLMGCAMCLPSASACNDKCNGRDDGNGENDNNDNGGGGLFGANDRFGGPGSIIY